jgi:hypothetical protein
MLMYTRAPVQCATQTKIKREKKSLEPQEETGRGRGRREGANATWQGPKSDSTGTLIKAPVKDPAAPVDTAHLISG